ncbi:hypothetical protein [Ruegeria intermedia]|uniref:hypothetical protein n=1 Tax=Ruegeria intermedia TaxID=996115 RepID=UPI00122C14E3|nr:hypothetical protein [Ruegeria intermedia]
MIDSSAYMASRHYILVLFFFESLSALRRKQGVDSGAVKFWFEAKLPRLNRSFPAGAFSRSQPKAVVVDSLPSTCLAALAAQIKTGGRRYCSRTLDCNTMAKKYYGKIGNI